MASVALLGTLDTKGVEYAFLRDPAAEAALILELKAGLRPEVEVVESATGINDPACATAIAERLDAHDRTWVAPAATNREGCAR